MWSKTLFNHQSRSLNQSISKMILLLAISFFGFIGLVNGQTLDFTYQGKLNSGSVPANGLYDFKFDLYDSLTGGTRIQTVTINGVQVTNGIFSVNLDFRFFIGGSVFTDGSSKYLEIWATNTGAFTTPLLPRQPIRSTPYSIRSLFSNSATAASSATNSSFLGGLLPSAFAQLNIDNTFSGNQTITGNLTQYGSQALNGDLTQSGNKVSMNPRNGFVVTGGTGGAIPIEGDGPRMMWYPGKSAFRAGNAQTTRWNDINIGYNSTAFGTSTMAWGSYSFVSGLDSVAFGSLSTAIGESVNADGDNSIALGRNAQVDSNDPGSFVFGDSSTSFFLRSFAPNSFSVRAAGGYRLYSNSAYTTGVSLSSGSGSWTSLSDRNAKDNINLVDTHDIFRRVLNLPISTWNYKGQEYRHIGPMAQDFYSIFNVGENDKTITTVDPDGIALAAIQGLNTELNEQLKSRDTTINALQSKLNKQEMLLIELKKLVCSNQMEAAACR